MTSISVRVFYYNCISKCRPKWNNGVYLSLFAFSYFRTGNEDIRLDYMISKTSLQKLNLSISRMQLNVIINNLSKL